MQKHSLKSASVRNYDNFENNNLTFIKHLTKKVL